MQGSNNISEFLYKLNVLYTNMNEFLTKLSESMTTNGDTVKVKFTDPETDEVSETVIPSVGSLNGKITAVGNQVRSLLNANEDTVSLEYQDGSVRSFSMDKVSELVDSLEEIENEEFQVPTSFKIKNNWFFESFLNPLLFVTLDVSDYVEDVKVDRFEVKKIIINPESTEQVAFFDDNIRNRNDLDHDSVVSEIEKAGIAYNVDDNTVSMPAAINRNSGRFSVVKVVDDEVDGNPRRRFQLDKLSYKRLTEGQRSTEFLSEGDRVLTSNDAEYEIKSLDRTNRLISVERIFGNDSITAGVSNLKIKPEVYVQPDLNVNVSYNERSVIFVRPVSRNLNMSTVKLSKGVGVYSNDLTITLSNNEEVDLETYYKNFVSDFGVFLMNMAKERTIPAAVGVQPDPPQLDADDFRVVPVNKHVKDDNAMLDLENKIKSKESIQNEINELDESINKLKSKLNKSVETVNRQRISKEIENKNNRRSGLVAQLSTLITEITLGLKSNSSLKTELQYHARGFFPIPQAKTSKFGDQQIVKFVTAYRRLSKKGTAEEAGQFKSAEGERLDIFSSWTEVESKLRGKKTNEDGTYGWSEEDTKDPNVVNINQVDIPIHPGEVLELRVKSVSEAGYPINPVTSEWSNTVTVPFPDEFETGTSVQELSDSIKSEESKIRFQEELNNRGLDLHLLDAFTKGDAYYAHKLESLASGFFTPEGNVINGFQWANDVSDRLRAVESAVKKEVGELNVYLESPDGNVNQINRGDTVSVFAGYYLDEVASESETQEISYNYGDVVSKTYVLNLENASQTPLELGVRVSGGISQRVPENGTGVVASDLDYNEVRKYDKTPIMITSEFNEGGEAEGFRHKAPFQTGQVRAQYMYLRYKDFGVDKELYAGPGADGGYDYDFEGQSVSGEQVPYNESHYLPYFPDYSGPSGTFDTHPDVWNGNADTGYGYLSDFCIHKDHPAISGKAATTINDFKDLILPVFDGSPQPYPLISHGLYFDLETGAENAFGVDPWKQVEYRRPSGTADHDPVAYPVKMGFSADDKYLIGRHTCGAYLYAAPPNTSLISTTGNHPGQKRSLKYGVRIKVPIVFEYRCADILENVGGYRTDDEVLGNVKYKKKIGIDVYEKLNSSESDPRYGDIFSFDVEVSCQHAREATTDAPVTVTGSGSGDSVTF